MGPNVLQLFVSAIPSRRRSRSERLSAESEKDQRRAVEAGDRAAAEPVTYRLDFDLFIFFKLDYLFICVENNYKNNVEDNSCFLFCLFRSYV